MSSINQNPCSGLGIFQSFFHAPNWGQWATAPQHSHDQMMRGFARWQLEVQGLMTRRAQAYMELPGRMAQCRTPQDFMSEQQRFWQICATQYSESTRQIMCAWAQIFQLPEPAMAGRRDGDGHDYLSFPETRPATGTSSGKPQQFADRKVA